MRSLKTPNFETIEVLIINAIAVSNGAGDIKAATGFIKRERNPRRRPLGNPQPRALANAPASLKETLHPKGAASINGNSGDDSLTGNRGDDNIIGGDGNDLIDGGQGSDILLGRAGNDSISGGRGRDRILGDAGNDSLRGGDRNDTLFGGSGNDFLAGNNGRDRLFGQAGRDTLNGGAGSDRILGGGGNDNLNGGGGDDTIEGNTGSDLLIGISTRGANADFGAGELDTLIGGGGSDTFVLGDSDRVYYDDGNDSSTGDGDFAIIRDFNIERDSIQLQGSADLYEISFSGDDATLTYIASSISTPETIAVLDDVDPSLSLDDSAFTFV